MRELVIFKDPATESKILGHGSLLEELGSKGQLSKVKVRMKDSGRVETHFINAEGKNFSREIDGIIFTKSKFGALKHKVDLHKNDRKHFKLFGEVMSIGYAEELVTLLSDFFD